MDTIRGNKKVQAVLKRPEVFWCVPGPDDSLHFRCVYCHTEGTHISFTTFGTGPRTHSTGPGHVRRLAALEREVTVDSSDVGVRDNDEELNGDRGTFCHDNAWSCVF